MEVFRKFFQLKKILAFLINLSLIEKIIANQDLKIVCYFTNWAVQRLVFFVLTFNSNSSINCIV